MQYYKDDPYSLHTDVCEEVESRANLKRLLSTTKKPLVVCNFPFISCPIPQHLKLTNNLFVVMVTWLINTLVVYIATEYQISQI